MQTGINREAGILDLFLPKEPVESAFNVHSLFFVAVIRKSSQTFPVIGKRKLKEYGEACLPMANRNEFAASVVGSTADILRVLKKYSSCAFINEGRFI